MVENTRNPEVNKASGAYLIAEIGTTHQGDKGQLKALIEAAAESGADCAKFQWVIADEIIHPNTGLVPLPTGNIRLYDRFRDLEFSADFFALAQEYCASSGIDFLCTPFGAQSAAGLEKLGVSAYKIASPELNHHPLIAQLTTYRRPLIVSSGVSTLADIDETLGLIRENFDDFPPIAGKLPAITLLHCITSYPAPEEDFNLLLIRSLAQILGVPLGLSDHSMDPVIVPLIAVLLGATIIEKHFTLSNDSDGLDDPIALAPIAFSEMVRAIRQVERHGDVDAASEISDKKALAQAFKPILHDFGKPLSNQRLEVILGTGVKRLARSEMANYGRTNRSIHALKDLSRGHRLKAEDFAVLRTEKVLRPGLHPRYIPAILGRVLADAVPSGEGIRWQDLA